MEKHKMSYKNNKFRMSGLMLNEKLNYQMDHIPYQLFKIILSIRSENILQCLGIILNF